MHAFSTSVLLAFSTAALSLASPLHRRQTFPGVTLLATNTIPLLTNQAINASNTAFWIGVETNTFCPVPAPECAGFPNTTSINVGSGGASMNSASPGGQDVYVTEAGALSFTDPHEEGNFPPGAFTTGFSVVTSDGSEHLAFSGGNSPGFIACPTTTAGVLPYQIFALVSSMGAVGADCVDVTVTTVPDAENGALAFQYE